MFIFQNIIIKAKIEGMLLPSLAKHDHDFICSSV